MPIKKGKMKPLELVTRRGMPIRYLDFAEVSDLFESYKKLHATMGLAEDFPPRDEVEATNVLYFLSDRLDRINAHFAALLQKPYGVHVGGQKAIAAINAAREPAGGTGTALSPKFPAS